MNPETFLARLRECPRPLSLGCVDAGCPNPSSLLVRTASEEYAVCGKHVANTIRALATTRADATVLVRVVEVDAPVRR